MSEEPEKSFVERARESIRRLVHLMDKEIWTRGGDENRARSFAILRILYIVWQGLNGNKLFSQAAALSYYSLIGLGPLLAIGIMISSFLIQGDERDNVIVEKLTQALLFVAPPVSEWNSGEDADVSRSNGDTNGSAADQADRDDAEASGETPEAEKNLNPAVIQFIDQIVQSARSGAVGVIGSLALIVIVIQLITSIEKAFNGIWGVRRGRSWAQRIMSYWTIASLGAVLSVTALTVLSASAIINRFDRLIPGVEYEDINRWAGPMISVFILTLVLAAFNRFFPHTSVQWKAAFAGGLLGAVLMLANHSLSFLYVDKVIRNQSLYGSVGIIPVLMFGLYLFWLIVLVSCQLTYAVQNAGNLTNQKAWSNVSPRTRESLTLACFLFIARRFLRCEAPPTTTQIADHLRVPGQLVNTCISQMSAAGWVRSLEPDSEDRQGETRFQPGFPLDRKSLLDFHNAFIGEGNNRGEDILLEVEPLLADFCNGFESSELLKRPIDQVLDQSPDTGGPP
ncbi:MAG: YhjD/YihY/BrkB family envelope integrity protein [Puniceicoccaceae bacterium]